MNVIITGRKVNLGDSFKELAENKLSKFDRIFEEDTVANLTVTDERNFQRVEITIRYGGNVYRAEKDAESMNESLDDAIRAIARQIRRNKSRLEKQLRSGGIYRAIQTKRNQFIKWLVVRDLRLCHFLRKRLFYK